MTFIIAVVIALLIFAMTRKYRNILSIFLAVFFLIITTTAVMAWVLWFSGEEDRIVFFYSSMGRSDLYRLMALWYVFDLICSIKIIKNYFDYKRANSTGS